MTGESTGDSARTAPEVTDAEWDQIRDAIVECRDRYPRRADDAPSSDVTDAVKPVVERIVAARLQQAEEAHSVEWVEAGLSWRARAEAAEAKLVEAEDWTNELASLLPEQYDDDLAQEAVIENAVRDMAEKLAAAEQLANQWEALDALRFPDGKATGSLAISDVVGKLRAVLHGKEGDGR